MNGEDRRCAAGRKAFYQGRWTEPCEQIGTNALGTDQGTVVILCDRHLGELDENGIVAESVQRDEWIRRTKGGG